MLDYRRMKEKCVGTVQFGELVSSLPANRSKPNQWKTIATCLLATVILPALSSCSSTPSADLNPATAPSPMAQTSPSSSASVAPIEVVVVQNFWGSIVS